MNPSRFLQLKQYPAVRKLLRTLVDMQFNDIRVMLLHPLCSREGGCNFSATSFICNIVSGISAILFKPDKGIGKDRFKELMEKYYPWDEDIDPKKGTKIIWNARNPITHRLGILVPRRGESSVRISKEPLTIRQIKKLENLSKASNIKTIIQERDNVYSINVIGLYRGLHKMLKNLFEDKVEMQKTNRYWERRL